jgi:hypothetical protein
MARIMIRCPLFNKPVPTGLTTDMIKLDSLDFVLTLECPACRKHHKWQREDAWIEKAKQDE